jgi:hypothetical protein
MADLSGRERSRSPARSSIESAKEAYKKALLEKLAAELSQATKLPQGSLKEFRLMLQQAKTSLTDDEVNFLFKEIATIDAAKLPVLHKVGQAFKISTLPLECKHLLGKIAWAIDKDATSFFAADKDKDGKLSYEEFRSEISRVLPGEKFVQTIPPSTTSYDEKVARLFAMMDTSCDGTVSLGEFRTALAELKQFSAPDQVGTIIKVTRHVYNARGGAPPYRGSYLTSTEEVMLTSNVTLMAQKSQLIPASGYSMFGGEPDAYTLPSGTTAPSKWESYDGTTPLGAKKLIIDPQGTTTASDVFKAGEQLVVLIPMSGMD